MKSEIRPTLLATVLCGLLGLSASQPLIAQNEFPAGNLTVTVQELENGGARFTLSGTATVQEYLVSSSEVENFGSPFTSTNLSAGPPTPLAFTSGPGIPLPAGLTLTILFENARSEPEGSESASLFLPTNEETLPITEVLFPKGNWCLGSFESAAPFPGSTITGAGTVTANDFPFFLLAPGTHRVGPPILEAEPEQGAEEGGLEYAPGQDEYFITYEVIPYTAAPAIRLSTPARFPKTRVRRSAEDQEVTITNTGNARLTRLSLAIAGTAAGDFSFSPLPVASLDPGASTKVSVGFRPHRKRTRQALLTVTGTTENRRIVKDSEEESLVENGDSEPDPEITVSDTVQLEGTGILQKPNSNRKPNSPRFPYNFDQSSN